VKSKRAKRVENKERQKASPKKLPPKADTSTIASDPGEARHADTAVSADTTAATVVWEFSKLWIGDISIEGLADLLDAKIKAVQHDDQRDAEALLIAQAVGLNSIYTACVVLARGNLVSNFGVAERLMRLGLKAQGQSRATLETLAVIKNPPTVFARQANIAHGPQQVNNGVSLARAGNSESEPNELLEAHGERLDVGAAGAAVIGDPALAAVGAIHRAADD
jgi:hypothetical protein